jgi:hypothetical protein
VDYDSKLSRSEVTLSKRCSIIEARSTSTRDFSDSKWMVRACLCTKAEGSLDERRRWEWANICQPVQTSTACQMNSAQETRSKLSSVLTDVTLHLVLKNSRRR